MKTQLTRTLEECLYTYNPDTTGGKPINKFRPRHIGYEVPVATGTISKGLVDCVRVDEILDNKRVTRVCSLDYNRSWYENHNPNVYETFNCPNGLDISSPLGSNQCDNFTCRFNSHHNQADCEIAITCYEIKVSREDFRSKNGHNFCGNANYYVMPNSLYKEVKTEIPEEIGVIVYKQTDHYTGLRRVKECVWKPLDAEHHRWMLLNVMKKQYSGSRLRTIQSHCRHLYSLIPRECSTCDSFISCELNDICIVNTQDPSHHSYWKCHEQEFYREGILLDPDWRASYELEDLLF